MGLKRSLSKIKTFKYYLKGRDFFKDSIYLDTANKTKQERVKNPSRTEIINFLVALSQGEVNYLEIGVRNPEHNFNHIQAANKYSVDPGVEFEQNPVDFKMTSDEFFNQLSSGTILSKNIKFDVIFIDGLHLAEQVDRDIKNALNFIKEDGFIVLHDCNPPTQWHAREQFEYAHTPAEKSWNGTTWKAFLKWRFNSKVYSCCVDTDWGVGVLSIKNKIGNSIAPANEFYEFEVLDKNRKQQLNLVTFNELKQKLQSS